MSRTVVAMWKMNCADKKSELNAHFFTTQNINRL